MTIFGGKGVLVTGGTGSMGHALVRRILSGSEGVPRRLRVLSRDEAKQHRMKARLEGRGAVDVQFRIGDVRSPADVAAALDGIDVVVNAAALKQVPTCEYEPEQSILTNCVGPLNIVRAIRELRLGVETVVGISTDKACKPVNVMGMTKALQERVFISANLDSGTRYVCVRYGNVLASRGSVIPLFIDQIRTKGHVTVTDPEMTRFLLTLDEAVDVVLSAIRDVGAGETLVPVIPSARVGDVAKALVGARRVDVRVLGPRPGEKKHEILVSEEERHRCARSGRYFRILPSLAEIRRAVAPEPCLEGEYSSKDGVIGVEQIADLLGANALTVDGYRPEEGAGL